MTKYYLQYVYPTGRVRDLHIVTTRVGWYPSIITENIAQAYGAKPIHTTFEFKLLLKKALNEGSLIFDEYDRKLTWKEFDAKMTHHDASPKYRSGSACALRWGEE